MQTHHTLLLLSSAGFCIGGFWLKRYADTGDLAPLALSFAFYLSANLLFARVLAHGLGAGMAMASMIQLCVMAGIGVFFFGERLTLAQLGGLLCALLAIGLFSVQPAYPPETQEPSASKGTGSTTAQ